MKTPRKPAGPLQQPALEKARARELVAEGVAKLADLSLVPGHQVSAMLDMVVRLANGETVLFFEQEASGDAVPPRPAAYFGHRAPLVDDGLGCVYGLTAGDRTMLQRWLRMLPTPSVRIFGEIKAAYESVIVYRAAPLLTRESSGRVQRRLETRVRAPNMRAALGWMFGHILAAGLGSHIRLCQKPSCSTYFVGQPDAKWHAPKCGVWVRQNARREKLKQRTVRSKK